MKKYEMSALIFLFKSAQNKSNMPNFKLCDVNFFIMYESVLSSLALEIFKISGMIGVWYHIFKLLKPYPKKNIIFLIWKDNVLHQSERQL